jgi:hypothetical protein
MNAIVIAATVNASKFSEFNDLGTIKPDSHEPAEIDGSPTVPPHAVFQP